jgi:hypothetical protein
MSLIKYIQYNNTYNEKIKQIHDIKFNTINGEVRFLFTERSSSILEPSNKGSGQQTEAR